jgi:hypothetical protein
MTAADPLQTPTISPKARDEEKRSDLGLLDFSKIREILQPEERLLDWSAKTSIQVPKWCPDIPLIEKAGSSIQERTIFYDLSALSDFPAPRLSIDTRVTSRTSRQGAGHAQPIQLEDNANDVRMQSSCFFSLL